MARRRLDPCLKNARKGEKILSSIISLGLKSLTSSNKKSTNNGCMLTIIYAIFLALGISYLASCNIKNNRNIAQNNIEDYLNKNAKEGVKFKIESCSDLYIIKPKDESNMPKPNLNGNNSDSDRINELKLRSAGLYLALGGCSPETLEQIIINDKKFREWNTGGKEFVMICFFTGKDKYLNETKDGLCFRLDSVLNVYKLYNLKNEKEIYNMILNN